MQFLMATEYLLELGSAGKQKNTKDWISQLSMNFETSQLKH